MANYNGFILKHPVAIQSAVDFRAVAYRNPKDAIVADLDLRIKAGTWAAGSPPSGISVAGYWENSHTEQYYNSIVFDPPVLNVGVITVDTNVGFDFFNGFLHAAEVTITDFQVTGGVATLNGRDVGSSFFKLENYAYSINVPAEGADEISIFATWTFDNGKTATYHIKGVRTTISVDLPEYPATETLSFKSMVSKTFTTEFRGSLREHPRHSVQFKYLLEQDSLSRMIATIYKNDTLNHTLPLWRESFPCGAIEAGGTTIPFGKEDHDIRVNQNMFLYDPQGVGETVNVIAVSANEITFPGVAVPMGEQTMAVPMITGFVRKAPKVSVKSRDIAQVNFMIESSTYYQWDYVVGVDALTDKYGWEKAPDGNYIWRFDNFVHGGAEQTGFTDRDFLDNISGLPEMILRAADTREYFTLNTSLHTQKELTEFKRVMYLANGKVLAFHIATNRHDVQLTQTSFQLGDTGVDISAVTGSEAYTGQTRMVKFQYADGSVFYTEAFFNSGTLMTVTPGLDREVLDVEEEISYVCFLPLVRLNTDDIVINHESHHRSTCKLPVVTTI